VQRKENIFEDFFPKKSLKYMPLKERKDYNTDIEN
jgi:hypothetical protein